MQSVALDKAELRQRGHHGQFRVELLEELAAQRGGRVLDEAARQGVAPRPGRSRRIRARRPSWSRAARTPGRVPAPWLSPRGLVGDVFGVGG